MENFHIYSLLTSKFMTKGNVSCYSGINMLPNIILSAVFVWLMFTLKQAYSHSLSSVGLNMLCTYYSINYWCLLCQGFENSWFRCSLLTFLPLSKCSQTQYFHPFSPVQIPLPVIPLLILVVRSENIWWVKGIT